MDGYLYGIRVRRHWPLATDHWTSQGGAIGRTKPRLPWYQGNLIPAAESSVFCSVRTDPTRPKVSLFTCTGIVSAGNFPARPEQHGGEERRGRYATPRSLQPPGPKIFWGPMTSPCAPHFPPPCQPRLRLGLGQTTPRRPQHTLPYPGRRPESEPTPTCIDLWLGPRFPSLAFLTIHTLPYLADPTG